MKISTKGRYALRIMLDLAACDQKTCTPLREIAQRQEISEKYLEAIVKDLVKARLVVGPRGKSGGYALAKAPADCTVGSILKCTEGSLAPVACLDSDENRCPRAGRCATLPMWRELDEIIDRYLEGVTLRDLMEQAKDGGEV